MLRSIFCTFIVSTIFCDAQQVVYEQAENRCFTDLFEAYTYGVKDNNFLFMDSFEDFDCNYALINNESVEFTSQNFRGKLKNLFSSLKYFSEVSFSLSDDTEYHSALKVYLDPIKKLSFRLQSDLKIENLYHFYQFQERIASLRQLSVLCLHEYRLDASLASKKKPSLKLWHSERIKAAEQKYVEGCSNLNNLHQRVVQAFTMAYTTGSFYRSLQNIYDYGLLELASGNIDNAIKLAGELIEKAKKDPNSSMFLTSDHYLSLGITYSEGLEYSTAIENISKAIEIDPQNKMAYFERAVAYFETKNFELAEQDFLISERHQHILIDNPVSQEFSSALMLGVAKGAKEAAIEFFPTLLNSAYGLSESLWIFAQHPLESTANFSNACYEAGICTVDYLKSLDLEKIQEYNEDLIALYQAYDLMSENQKGEIIGYLVGKCGVDILIPGTTVKAIAASKKLRVANQICNFETMTVSTTNRELIRANALKFAAERERYFKTVKYNFDAHNKHVLGHNDFKEGRSIWTHPDPEGLLAKFAGTGNPERGAIGSVGYKETIDFGECIGIWKNKEGSVSLSTTRGTIHYSNKGAHIVPSNPKPKAR
jgi:tetratricopeptide (TPR) repeat protein